jgi:pyruvate dehydrogenase E1 component beta subunit
VIIDSVRKTGRLVAVDGGWRTCGMAAEVMATAVEALPTDAWRATPKRVTLPDAPAPSARCLERMYYPQVEDVVANVRDMCR